MQMLQRLRCGQEVDWWVLGIIIYTMLMGTLHFYDSIVLYRLERKVSNADVEYLKQLSQEAN